MNRPSSAVGNAIASLLLLILIATGVIYAQQDVGSAPGASSANSSPSPASSTSPPNAANSWPSSTSSPTAAPSTNRVESSLFYWLNMSGRKRADFKPLTAGQKAKFYAKGLFGPFMFFSAATSAGITQAMDVPRPWGQGAEGYFHRFGNYYAKQAVQRTLRLGGEELLHEDNRYFQSGEHGVGRRIFYALKSSVMARGNDGRQHISISEIGSIAGASFISRLWQPSTNSSAGDGAVSFGIGMGVNAGVNIAREFLPDISRHVFRRAQQTQVTRVAR